MSRPARFAWVGAGGFVVQTGVLYALAAAGVTYPLATAIAVEAAILHNFFWHERWTWADRLEPVAGLKTHGYGWTRLLRFNGATAVVSVAGNVALMALLVERVGLPLLPASLASVLILSALNYTTADRLIFPAAGLETCGRERPALPTPPTLPTPPAAHRSLHI